MNSAERTKELYIQYRDFGGYMIGYLGVQDSNCSADTEEAVMRLANTHWRNNEKYPRGRLDTELRPTTHGGEDG